MSSNDWRSSLSHIDVSDTVVRGILVEAFENMKMTLALDDAAAAHEDRLLGRIAGGLDRSIHAIGQLLGGEHAQYSRRLHDDGCWINTEDEEFGGHDMCEGCEEGDRDEGEW
jgi:hypothetical protein